MSIEKDLLEKAMPILSKGAEAEYLETVKVFRELITNKEEDNDFFDSPVSYLKSRKLISIDKITLPSGEEVQLFGDNELAAHMRRSREIFQAGGDVTLPDALVYKEDVLVEKRYAVYSDYKAVLVTDFHVTPGEIGNIDFGPLMSPHSKAKLKAYIEAKALNGE